MNEDFVPVKIANKLKEKGFNKPCVAYYVSSCSKLYFNITQLRGCSVEDCFISRNTQQGFNGMTLTDAPTISQVLKWLRKKKKISIQPLSVRGGTWEAQITFTDDNDVTLKKLFEDKSFGTDDRFTSYEQASFAGIEYVLDNML